MATTRQKTTTGPISMTVVVASLGVVVAAVFIGPAGVGKRGSTQKRGKSHKNEFLHWDFSLSTSNHSEHLERPGSGRRAYFGTHLKYSSALPWRTKGMAGFASTLTVSTAFPVREQYSLAST